jgi:dipeptidyl aminopeptidase/acylaminoacyl peptidase
MLLTLCSVGCRMSLSPIKNKIGIGVESYVVFEADGEDGQGDLYAGSSSGGSAYRLTFSRVHEYAPALSPDGSMLAFIRGRTRQDTSSHRVWIMNLLNGAERELPQGSGGRPLRVGWSRDGQTLYVSTTSGDFFTPSPPAPSDLKPVGSQAAQADSALSVLLGEPAMAMVTQCPGGQGLCVPADSGGPQVLSTEGRDAFRWGSDSVGFWVADVIEVRPLGGGTTRQLRWTGMPAHPGGATHFSGLLRE